MWDHNKEGIMDVVKGPETLKVISMLWKKYEEDFNYRALFCAGCLMRAR